MYTQKNKQKIQDFFEVLTCKNPKNKKKSKYFFEDLKSAHSIWEGTTPRIQ
jgi:hypothetical protein